MEQSKSIDNKSDDTSEVQELLSWLRRNMESAGLSPAEHAELIHWLIHRCEDAEAHELSSQERVEFADWMQENIMDNAELLPEEKSLLANWLKCDPQRAQLSQSEKAEFVGWLKQNVQHSNALSHSEKRELMVWLMGRLTGREENMPNKRGIFSSVTNALKSLFR